MIEIWCLEPRKINVRLILKSKRARDHIAVGVTGIMGDVALEGPFLVPPFSKPLDVLLFLLLFPQYTIIVSWGTK